MVVVPNPEPFLDQVANHRTGPHARLVPSRDWPEPDDDGQRLPLLLGQFRRRPLRDRSPKSVNVVGVVPLNPAIYRPASNAEVGGDLDDASSINVCPNGTASPPLAEVVLELGFENELVKLSELRGAATRAPNGLPCLGSSHDQVTMILSRSAVKRGSQATRSCLVG
jgi:hypothetical protein